MAPEVGLRLLDELATLPALTDYHLFHAARADLLRRLGRLEAAQHAYRRALELVTNDPEKKFLCRRLAELSAS